MKKFIFSVFSIFELRKIFHFIKQKKVFEKKFYEKEMAKLPAAKPPTRGQLQHRSGLHRSDVVGPRGPGAEGPASPLYININKNIVCLSLCLSETSMKTKFVCFLKTQKVFFPTKLAKIPAAKPPYEKKICVFSQNPKSFFSK